MMIKVLSWNIQWGLGVDGQISLHRIADVIREMGDFDVICLQEVARFDKSLTGDNGLPDQPAAFGNLFQGYEAVFGPAVDRLNKDGSRRQFGNMILSRLPILQIFQHQLPQPLPELETKHMPRQATEVVVDAGGEAVRITSTHFEFHSEAQRVAEAEYLATLQANIDANQQYQRHAPVTGPYAAIPRPVASILCGDFNSAPDDIVYQTLCTEGENGTGYKDAWRIAKDSAGHMPTCGIFDHVQWPEGPHCRDFFFVAGDLKARDLEVSVNTKTDASDHQPIMLTVT